MARGVPATIVWLAEEVGELAGATRKGTRRRAVARVGDTLAWLASLATSSGCPSRCRVPLRDGCPRSGPPPAPAREPLTRGDARMPGRRAASDLTVQARSSPVRRRASGVRWPRASPGPARALAASSRKQDLCDQVAADIADATGARRAAAACHVGEWDPIPAFVDAVHERFGSIDVLVNNAGHQPGPDHRRRHDARVLAQGVRGPTSRARSG